jgi:hypothetical protein
MAYGTHARVISVNQKEHFSVKKGHSRIGEYFLDLKNGDVYRRDIDTIRKHVIRWVLQK